MKIIVTMIARNESHRHLKKALDCAKAITVGNGGVIAYTDDASTDNSVHLAIRAGAQVQTTPEPMFWTHEGRARNRAYSFAASFAEPGDWILALDADETINKPQAVLESVEKAASRGFSSIALPLHEFWTPDQYRVDGFWFGTAARRLFAYREGAAILDREMACGSEPTWVPLEPTFYDHPLHLLHWGYVLPEDRPRKHAAYTSRLGGHGHNNAHVNSIITEPVLADYNWEN